MAHTYGSCLYHFVFSTRGRIDAIKSEWIFDLWEYMGGIARNSKMSAICIGGIENHVHALIMIPPSVAPAKGIQLIKANSSKWVNETLRPKIPFGWQEGYGVFTIGFSQIAKTREYIMTQAEHHRHTSFEEEYRAFLRKHMIAFEEDYIFD
ncbi:MAG TPA: IS200/IS605 family transposase [Candidatus Sumerlaeota bacterium]|nr:IS200/IS605 family transposase [Candidatus Sumerlaeota bacterium]HOR26659.1 IS200/IS605 family transposase [Candidatus Sumerlaeota bacterium]HPK03944.1 IS200/IS605 family transposase [Candidatus Sumerlaeota bacterium]